VGGNFTAINRSNKDYMVSLDVTTGRDDGYINLDISGKYIFTDQNGQPNRSNSTHIYNTALSPNGRRLLAMGVFTSVGGQARQQIFMLNLGATVASVNPWYSKEFDQNCAGVQPFWLRDASWSPDKPEIYVATTGYKPARGTGFNTRDRRGGLCDAVAAFPSGASSNQTHTWINYTGCDSLYSTAADSSAVYTGGHQRWLDNELGCDSYRNPADLFVVSAPGMGGIHATGPDTGKSILDGNGLNANGYYVNKYAKGRGIGATDMLITPAGLWIASDNAQNVSFCGKTAAGTNASGRSGLCFLPY
jgi:hypothetical protein